MIIYGLMKYVEQAPARYDRIMNILTLGAHTRSRELMLASVSPGSRVLDLGCGPGTFAIAAAKKGAVVTGVDASREMIRTFKERAAGQSLEVEAVEAGCASIDKILAGRNFDLIVISLVLGELPEPVMEKAVAAAASLLAPRGTLVVCDELWPENQILDLVYRFMFWVFFIPNFLLTRTLIQPVKGFRRIIAASGLREIREATLLMGAMKIFWLKRGQSDERV